MALLFFGLLAPALHARPTAFTAEIAAVCSGIHGLASPSFAGLVPIVLASNAPPTQPTGKYAEADATSLHMAGSFNAYIPMIAIPFRLVDEFRERLSNGLVWCVTNSRFDW